MLPFAPPAAVHLGFLLLVVVGSVGLGYFIGLHGYAQASRDAYRRLVAAQQRPVYTWPDSAP